MKQAIYKLKEIKFSGDECEISVAAHKTLMTYIYGRTEKDYENTFQAVLASNDADGIRTIAIDVDKMLGGMGVPVTAIDIVVYKSEIADDGSFWIRPSTPVTTFVNSGGSNLGRILSGGLRK
jgi:hypothetical protein